MTVNHCETLRERMPVLAAGGAQPSEDERRHLGQCPGCAAEWQLVQRAASLGDDVAARIDPETLAAGVLERLRREPEGVPIRRRGWWVAGLVAAAATIALVLSPLVRNRPDNVEPPALPVVWLVPELDGLETSELLLVLATFAGPSDGDIESGLPLVDDLEALELEQVLRAWEG